MEWTEMICMCTWTLLSSMTRYSSSSSWLRTWGFICLSPPHSCHEMKPTTARGSAPKPELPQITFFYLLRTRIPPADLEILVAILNTLCQPLCIIIWADTAGELPKKQAARKMTLDKTDYIPTRIIQTANFSKRDFTYTIIHFIN